MGTVPLSLRNKPKKTSLYFVTHGLDHDHDSYHDHDRQQRHYSSYRREVRHRMCCSAEIQYPLIEIIKIVVRFIIIARVQW